MSDSGKLFKAFSKDKSYIATLLELALKEIEPHANVDDNGRVSITGFFGDELVHSVSYVFAVSQERYAIDECRSAARKALFSCLKKSTISANDFESEFLAHLTAENEKPSKFYFVSALATRQPIMFSYQWRLNDRTTLKISNNLANSLRPYSYFLSGFGEVDFRPSIKDLFVVSSIFAPNIWRASDIAAERISAAAGLLNFMQVALSVTKAIGGRTRPRLKFTQREFTFAFSANRKQIESPIFCQSRVIDPSEMKTSPVRKDRLNLTLKFFGYVNKHKSRSDLIKTLSLYQEALTETDQALAALKFWRIGEFLTCAQQQQSELTIKRLCAHQNGIPAESRLVCEAVRQVRDRFVHAKKQVEVSYELVDEFRYVIDRYLLNFISRPWLSRFDYSRATEALSERDQLNDRLNLISLLDTPNE